MGRKAAVSHSVGIGPAYRALDRLLQDKSFLDLMGEIAGIPERDTADYASGRGCSDVYNSRGLCEPTNHDGCEVECALD